MKKTLFLPLIFILFWSCSQVKLLNPMQVISEDNKQEKETQSPEKKRADSTPVKVADQEMEGEDQGDDSVDDLDEAVAKDSSGQSKREQKAKALKAYCAKTDESFKRFGWGDSHCEDYRWNFVRTSVNGDPLIWKTFGSPAPEGDQTETTLIMCGVHGDEITPIKFCYDVLEYLEEVSKGKVTDPHTGKLATLAGKRVIVAPLVNPDSYFKNKPTRTNANGVDVNRNFPTKDFKEDAIKTWASRYNKDKRRYPGKKAMSEPETIFQVNLIYRYQPHKIISVHAPLTMLDYDGPANEHMGGFVGSRANQLLIRMSEQAKGYRIKNYPFFTGSLGNYAGNERNIPTFTLELPSSNPAKSQAYWHLFKDSIHSAVMHEIKGEGFVALDREDTTYKDTRSN